MNASRFSTRSALSALALAALVVAGCGGPSTADLTASGKALMAQKDYAGAIIQFKNALQSNPDAMEVRLQLGLALLEMGDPVAAQVELAKARELQASDTEVVPPLARAMVLVGDEAKLIAQFGDLKLPDPAAQADLGTSLATAFMLRGDTEQARQRVMAALQAKPGYAPATVLQARLTAAAGDFDGALALLDGLLAREPGNDRAALLRGEILWHGKKDTAGALEAFRKALAANPKAVAAHTSIMSLLGQAGRNDEVKTQLAQLKQVAPNHPETLFYDAQLAFVEGDFKRSRDLTDRLLKALPDSPRVLELAGAAEYRMKQYPQAESFLLRALKAQPGQRLARQVLAQTYLRTNQPGKVIELLEPVLASPNIDSATVTLAGEAYAQLGEAKKADEAFARASKIAPDDARVRTSAAVAQLMRGNAGAAANQLEAIAAEDKGTRADMALITARLRQNDIAGAMKAIDGLERKIPDRPVAQNLRGRVLLLKRDLPGATKAFEAALAKDPGYFPAVASLAAMDFAAGKPDAARQRFEELTRSRPKSPEPWLALHELALRTGAAPDQALGYLRSAVKANAGEQAPHVQLVNYLLSTGDSKSALTAAREGVAALPSSMALKDALGRAQLANGSPQEAASTFREMATAQPADPNHPLRLAEALVAQKDLAGARAALRKSLEIRPGYPLAQRGLAQLALMEKRPDEAVQIARTLQKDEPKSPLGLLLEADAEASRGNGEAAVGAARRAHQLARTSDTAIRLHAHLRQAGKAVEADRWAGEWSRESPRDVAFRYYLGDVAIGQGSLAVAEGHYRAVLAVQPNNPLAMNNVAWLLARQGKPGSVELARKANELLPGKGQLMDTLATALAAEGQLPEAIKVQKDAIARNPADATLKLGLAKLLIQSGDKTYARAELEDLAKLGDKFRGQAEVAALLKSL